MYIFTYTYPSRAESAYFIYEGDHSRRVSVHFLALVFTRIVLPAISVTNSTQRRRIYTSIGDSDIELQTATNTSVLLIKLVSHFFISLASTTDTRLIWIPLKTVSAFLSLPREKRQA